MPSTILLTGNSSLPEMPVSTAHRRLLFSAAAMLLATGLALAWLDSPWWGAALGPAVALLPLAFLKPEAGWWLILLVTPFSVETTVPTFGAAIQFPTELILFTTLLFWIPQRLARFPLHTRLSLLDTMIVLLFAAAVFSITVSESPVVSVKGVLNLGWYLAAGYAMTTVLIADRARIQAAIGMLIVLSLGFGLYGILLYLQNTSAVVQGDFGRQVPEPFFHEHGSYASYIMFGFCLALAFGVRLTRSFGRILLFLAAVVLFIAIIFSGTRASWVSLLAPAGILGGYHLFRKFHPVKLLTAGVLMAAIGYGIYAWFVSATISSHAMSIGDVESNMSNLERLNRWVAALHMWKAAPLTGHGWSMYKFVYPHFRDPAWATSLSLKEMGAHSEYLTILAESGLMGFLPFLGIVYACRRMYRRVIHHSTDLLFIDAALGLAAAIGAYLLHGFFNNYMMYDKVAVPFWVSIGLLAAVYRLSVKETTVAADKM